MISDIINGILGILLVYVAVLQDAFLHSSRGSLFAAVVGIAIIVLSSAARTTRDAWYSRLLTPLGTALLLFAVFAYFIPVQLIVAHWFVFWVGVFAAVIALWGALYPHALEPQN